MGRSIVLTMVLLWCTTAFAGNDASALIAKASALADEGEYIQARRVYEELEKISGYEGRALHGQAVAAAAAGDEADAIELAQRASSKPGKHKMATRMLYADLLARQGEHKRAKDFYVAIYKSASGDMQAIAKKKLANMNRALALPSDDGAVITQAPVATESGDAVFERAKAAYAQNDMQEALRLAQRAATLPGNQKLDAKFLYADALFRQFDYKRAKDFYVALHRATSGAHRTHAAHRIAAVNKALKLPETDGL